MVGHMDQVFFIVYRIGLEQLSAAHDIRTLEVIRVVTVPKNYKRLSAQTRRVSGSAITQKRRSETRLERLQRRTSAPLP